MGRAPGRLSTCEGRCCRGGAQCASHPRPVGRGGKDGRGLWKNRWAEELAKGGVANVDVQVALSLAA
eukprot:25906-Chlamydomonas_euryale.AAC.3